MKKNLILLIVFVSLGAIAWFVFSKNQAGTIADDPLANFAIKDTASINKIVITNQFGEMATVERVPGEKLWRLNNKYEAREDAVNLILKTIYRISLRGNVSDKSRDNVMKTLATAGKRVEIFTGGEQPAKIYYIGTATADHTGTIMLLEIPGIGRSEEPYITHMEGFTGFLSTRFFTDETEWRYTGIFEYPTLEFNDVKIINHEMPWSSIEVKYNGGNNIQLYSGYNPASQSFNTREEKFDSLAVKDLLLLFKKLHVESFNTMLRPEIEDSLRKSIPAYTVIIHDNRGRDKSIDLYLKRAVKETYDGNGNLDKWDVDHMWAKTQIGEFALAQTFNFGPILRPLEYYTPGIVKVN